MSNFRMMEGHPKQDDAFGDKLCLFAAVLDPRFALHWVDLYVGCSSDDRPTRKQQREDVKAELKGG